jgi:hypothetical protein
MVEKYFINAYPEIKSRLLRLLKRCHQYGWRHCYHLPKHLRWSENSTYPYAYLCIHIFIMVELLITNVIQVQIRV